MFQITCVDENGEPLSGLTQWDVNRSLYVENYKYDFAPMFHFCNKFSKKSLGVKSVLSDGKLSVDVPNELLREPFPIIAYVFLSENETGKTLQTIHLPVRPKVQPSDYEYVDNIRVVYLEDLIAEVQELKDKLDKYDVDTEQIESNKNDIDKLKSDLNALKETGIPSADIEKAVSDYLTKHPVSGGLSEAQVNSLIDNKLGVIENGTY